ncbi:helix-turn-helix transcriptional regulator [Gallaecimonas pentaromativorans]|uniref:helix-turn-helix transcriptional regulator n=1 Tax=Gallaecimonas pentaromativorans TaxID=584787 RepID=UPI003A9528C0
MRFIKLKEVQSLTSLSRATIYRYIDAGHFPKQVSLGDHNVAWVEEEVLEWIQERIADRDRAKAA